MPKSHVREARVRLDLDVFHVKRRRVTNLKPDAAGAAADRMPKLYVVTHRRDIAYVGAAPGGNVRRRLVGGLSAKGRHGYRGYPWKNLHVSIHVASAFCFRGPADTSLKHVTEALETELVFQKRAATGVWPTHQHEVHFHNLKAPFNGLVQRQAARLWTELAKNGYC